VVGWWTADEPLIDQLQSESNWIAFHFQRIRFDWDEYAWIPEVSHYEAATSHSYAIKYLIPFWIPFAAFAVATLFLRRSERRDRRRGACGECGYDLTGNVSGRCPECGAAAEPAAERKRPS